MKLFDSAEKWLLALNKKLALAGASFLLIEVFLTIANIVGRYLFNSPIRSTYEVCQLFMVVVLSCCWAYTESIQGHVRVDIFEVMFPAVARRVLNLIMQLLGLAVFGTLTWSLIKTGLQYLKMGSSTDALQIPVFPFAFLMALGALMSVIVILFQAYRAFKRLRDKGK